MSIEYTTQPVYRSGIVTSAIDVLPGLNRGRRTIILQNLGTNTLYVKFGTGATTSDFDFILKASTVQDDGTGGIFTEKTLSYQGILSVAGTSPRCIATAF
jgi:hypothetical protein